MTIESNISAQTLLGDGEARVFPFTFKAFAEQVKVIVTAPDGMEEDITSLCGINLLPSGGGVVTYPIAQEAEALPSGYKLTIMRNMDFLQETNFVTGARYSSEVIEQRLDKLTAQDQQLKEELGRTLKVGVGSGIEPENVISEVFNAKNEAVTAKENAEMSRLGAETARLGAEAAKTDTEMLKGESLAAKNLAEKWANENEDVIVEAEKYSAKHYAIKAEKVLVQNGPIATPAQAGLVPAGGQAGQFFGVSNDGLSYGFLPSTYLGDVRLLNIPASMLPRFGWYTMNGNKYPVDSPVGQRLLEIAELEYLQDFLSNCPISTKVKQLAGEPQNRFPALASNSTPSPYRASASTSEAGYDPWKAFNRTTISASDVWAAGSSSSPIYQPTLILSLGQPQNIAITKYEIRSRNSTTINYPIGWTLYVGESPDENVNDWIQIDGRTGQAATQNQLQTYTISSPQALVVGKIMFSFFASTESPGQTHIGYINFFTDTWTEIETNTVNIPNWAATIPDYVGAGGTSPGGVVMPFMRPISGARQVGSVERDATRKITGAIDRPDSAPNYFNAGFCASPNNIFLGILSSTRRGGNFQVAASGTPNFQGQMLDINSSNVVPTGPENTVTNRGMTPAIYLGV